MPLPRNRRESDPRIDQIGEDLKSLITRFDSFEKEAHERNEMLVLMKADLDRTVKQVFGSNGSPGLAAQMLTLVTQFGTFKDVLDDLKKIGWIIAGATITTGVGIFLNWLFNSRLP